MNMGEVLDKVSLLGGGEPEYGVVSELSEAARGVFGSCGGGGRIGCARSLGHTVCREEGGHQHGRLRE